MSLLAILAVVANPPAAAPSAEAWAECIWQTVPTSAANWLMMAVEPEIPLSSSKYKQLRYRLRSACWATFMPKPEKVGLLQEPEPFNQQLVREALIRTRPQAIGSDRPVKDAVLCQAFDGPKLVAQYFGFHSLEPYGGYRVTCGRIANDGSIVPHA
jgi:hypothetical protein